MYKATTMTTIANRIELNFYFLVSIYVVQFKYHVYCFQCLARSGLAHTNRDREQKQHRQTITVMRARFRFCLTGFFRRRRASHLLAHLFIHLVPIADFIYLRFSFYFYLLTQAASTRKECHWLCCRFFSSVSLCFNDVGLRFVFTNPTIWPGLPYCVASNE